MNTPNNNKKYGYHNWQSAWTILYLLHVSSGGMNSKQIDEQFSMLLPDTAHDPSMIMTVLKDGGGLVDNPTRGFWSLTVKGEKVISSIPEDSFAEIYVMMRSLNVAVKALKKLEDRLDAIQAIREKVTDLGKLIDDKIGS